MLVFREEGMGQYRQGAGSMLSVCIGIKKLVDDTGLLECEPSGNWLFDKVDDSLQSLTAYNVQQFYCLLKSGYKVGYDAILLRESRLIRFLIVVRLLR